MQGDSGSLQQPFPLVPVSLLLRDVLTASFRIETDQPPEGGSQLCPLCKMPRQSQPLWTSDSGSSSGDGGQLFMSSVALKESKTEDVAQQCDLHSITPKLHVDD